MVQCATHVGRTGACGPATHAHSTLHSACSYSTFPLNPCRRPTASSGRGSRGRDVRHQPASVAIHQLIINDRWMQLKMKKKGNENPGIQERQRQRAGGGRQEQGTGGKHLWVVEAHACCPQRHTHLSDLSPMHGRMSQKVYFFRSTS